MTSRSPWYAQTIICAILLGFMLLILFPFYYVVTISVMPNENYVTRAYHLLPDGFTLDYYRLVFGDARLVHALGVSVFVTLVGTLLNVIVTGAGAYVLTKSHLRLHGALNLMVIVPLMFGGGMIPLYLVIRALHLTNNVWGLIIPFLCNSFYVVLMKNFFSSLPGELEEAAYIDGAKEIKTFSRIVLPLSKPILAVMTLFYGVFHWNEFFWSGILVAPDKYPMMVLLRQLIRRADTQMQVQLPGLIPMSLTSAIIIVMIVPILAISPLIQRFFVKGMVLGAVKS
ncbi:carbohydrate ABC transporter permease [Cohnella fermenti]|uniref:Carbohydrate ABC transporter permease n=1 Tax=Cohnella fermenti TaxID=2565925 RepID=A0A4S4BPG6_9BACL|nr:carbohydrate ABC transporter permease [Cohnella fermenti]THF76262.1 carbohydrate ABC transporter permease [Cohnella fermenti]